MMAQRGSSFIHRALINVMVYFADKHPIKCLPFSSASPGWGPRFLSRSSMLPTMYMLCLIATLSLASSAASDDMAWHAAGIHIPLYRPHTPSDKRRDGSMGTTGLGDFMDACVHLRCSPCSLLAHQSSQDI